MPALDYGPRTIGLRPRAAGWHLRRHHEKRAALRPANFYAAARGEASYAGSVIYALACHVLAALLAGAYDLTFASVAGTLDDISVIRNEALQDISDHISERLEAR